MPIRELGHFTVRRLFAIAVQHRSTPKKTNRETDREFRRAESDEINVIGSYLGLFKIDESPRNRVQQKRDFLLNNDAQLHFLVTTSCGVVVARTFQIRWSRAPRVSGVCPW